MVVCASALFASTTLLAKFLGTGSNALHPLQVSAGRFAFALMALLIVGAFLRPKFSRPNLKVHLLRTVCGWVGVSLMFTAVARIALSDATAISFLNPVFGMMLAVFILHEKVGPIRWTAAFVAVAGAVVLLRPGADSFQPAALFALGAALFFGLEVTLIKLLSGREAPIQILLINNTLGAIIALTAASFVWQSPSLLQWGALAGIGVIMASGQALFIQAMRSGDASYVLPFSYSTLVFAALFDFWIFAVVPDNTSIIGAGIIIFGALMLAWREAVKGKLDR